MASPPRKWLFSVVAIVLAFGLVELFAYGALFILKSSGRASYAPIYRDRVTENNRKEIEVLLSGQNKYIGLDATCGWTILPNGTSKLYQSNAAGFRANREYAPKPPEGIVRVLAFGDSFTHGDQIGNDDTWENVLEKSNPKLEILNFGVPGYGPDQAWLRYQQKGKGYEPRIVMMGFMPENIHRVVNVFRPFYYEGTGTPLAKPRFVLRGDGLELVPSELKSIEDYQNFLREPGPALARMGARDFHYGFNYGTTTFDFLATVRLGQMVGSRLFANHGPMRLSGEFNPNSEALAIVERVLTGFAAEVRADGARPVVLITPGVSDIERLRDGRSIRYAPLLEVLKQRGLEVWDGREAFVKYGATQDMKELFTGHYAPEGARVVARWLGERLAAELR